MLLRLNNNLLIKIPPYHDEVQLGVEQGGINYGEYYEIFGKEQISSAQSSKLDVDVGMWEQNVSAIEEADDTAIISKSVHNLQN